MERRRRPRRQWQAPCCSNNRKQRQMCERIQSCIVISSLLLVSHSLLLLLLSSCMLYNHGVAAFVATHYGACVTPRRSRAKKHPMMTMNSNQDAGDYEEKESNNPFTDLYPDQAPQQLAASEDSGNDSNKSWSVTSAAGAATSSLSQFAHSTSALSESLTNTTTSRLAGLGEKGASTVKSTASATTSSLTGLAEKGKSGLQFAASAAKSGAQSAASAATSALTEVATAATSGFSSLKEKGTPSSTEAAVTTFATTPGSLSSRSAAADDGKGMILSRLQQPLTSAATSTLSSLAKTSRWMRVRGRRTVKMGGRSASAKTQALLLGFTGKEDSTLGDVIKELNQRNSSSLFKLQDVVLLLKVVVAIGASIGPLAQVLPLTLLLDMFNMSLEAQVGKEIIEVLAFSVDERLAAAFDVQAVEALVLGDIARRTLLGTILSFTGKDVYEFGDIMRAVTKQQGQQNSVVFGDSKEETTSTSGSSCSKTLELDTIVGSAEFEEWDKAFRESHSDFGSTIAQNLVDYSTAARERNIWGYGVMSPTANYLTSLDMPIETDLEELMSPSAKYLATLATQIAVELEEWDDK